MEKMPTPIAYLEGDHWYSWDRSGRPQYVAAIKFSNGMIFDNIRGWLPGAEPDPASRRANPGNLTDLRFNALEDRLNALEDLVEKLTAMAAARAVKEEGQLTITELAQTIKNVRDEARTAIVNEVQREMRERVNHVALVAENLEKLERRLRKAVGGE